MLKYCNAPFEEISIHGDGSVFSCICGTWNTKGSIGNLFESSLSQIYQGESIADLRQTVLDQSFKYCNKRYCGKIWNLEEVQNLDFVDKNPVLPTLIYFQDLDRSCNLKCPSCRLEAVYSKEVNKSAERILEIIKRDYQGFDKEVRICGDGMGEVFASQAYLNWMSSPDLPDCFRLSFNTNGNLLTKRLDLIDKLGQRMSTLTVCIDAATPRTYKMIRGGNFDLVIKGIKAVIDRGINVNAQMVVQAGNYKEILQYRDLCLDLGVSHMGLQRINQWGHMSTGWWRMNDLDNNPDIDMQFLIYALQEFKKNDNAGIDGGLQSLVEKYNN